MITIKEEFKPITGYEAYEVSTLGVIKKGNKIMNPPTYSTGYKVQKLSRNGKSKRVMVHRLVAETFIPKQEGKDVVNHKDGNKQNNAVTNLEWCTLQENCNHATKYGLKSKGSTHPTSKLKEEDIPSIRLLLEAKVPQRKIAEQYGVCQATIRDIKNNLTWKHVNGTSTVHIS